MKTFNQFMTEASSLVSNVNNQSLSGGLDRELNDASKNRVTDNTLSALAQNRHPQATGSSNSRLNNIFRPQSHNPSPGRDAALSRSLVNQPQIRDPNSKLHQAITKQTGVTVPNDVRDMMKYLSK